MEAFIVPVSSLKEAILILDTLAKYDLFQYEMNIKPDYSNTGGLNRFENGEWVEWQDEETGYDIDEWIRKD